MSYEVEVCSPEEARRYIKMVTKGGLLPTFEGFVDAVCRNDDGSVAWEIHQKNVVTEYGRRVFGNSGAYSLYLFTSPCNEDADPKRYALLDAAGAGVSSQISAAITASAGGVTWTRTYQPSAFSAPAANRTIGTIGLSGTSALSSGARAIVAYTALSPVKVQSTTQTLEATYRIRLIPNW